MLVGEAPGQKKMSLVFLFAVKSGMLLDTMLSTVKLTRKENIYILLIQFLLAAARQ